NKLPGKEGKRWIVLPFSPEAGLDVCLRILLAPTPGGVYATEQMIMDIQGKESRWVFILRTGENALLGDRSAAPDTCTLARYPAPTKAEAKALERTAAEMLGLGAVRVRKDDEFPLFAEDNRDWTLRSINKEV
ncbi:MAG: hypothetical protein LBT39_09905, partial [Treponema sp.]|nr:hypothetical protein [Treponema sp.]